MISRVAESCYWLQRYMERADATARLLEVNRILLLDGGIPPRECWRPLVVVAGEEKRFLDRYSERAFENGNRVQSYLVWESANPVSVYSSLHSARENARTIRETISNDMWSAINAYWWWFRGGAGKRLYRRDRGAFFAEVSRRAQLFRGLTIDTMLYDEPFDFMRLGVCLERADQTARLLDVRFEQMAQDPRAWHRVDENSLLLALLQSSGALESFFKRVLPLRSDAVVQFLVLEPDFPRSVLYNVERANNFMQRIVDSGAVSAHGGQGLASLASDLRGASIDTILEAGVHDYLTSVVSRLGQISSGVRQDFFDLDASVADD